MSTRTIEKAVEALRELPGDRQQEALDFIEFLRLKYHGVLSLKPGAYVKHFGTLPADTAAQMERVIGECCEQIDLNEWPDLPRH